MTRNANGRGGNKEGFRGVEQVQYQAVSRSDSYDHSTGQLVLLQMRLFSLRACVGGHSSLGSRQRLGNVLACCLDGVIRRWVTEKARVYRYNSMVDRSLSSIQSLQAIIIPSRSYDTFRIVDLRRVRMHLVIVRLERSRLSA